MQAIQENVSPLIDRIQNQKSLNIVITTHHKPDGDAMGSSLALRSYLLQYGHNVQVITPTDYPEFLNWLPGNDDVLIFEEKESSCVTMIANADYIFCLDFNDLKRINQMGEHVRSAPAKKVMIDHHREPVGFEDFRFWTYDASSTCELIYQFIQKAGDTEMINRDVADCIYTGMMTDTGSFRYRGTGSETHRIVADLIDKGARNSEIHEFVYDSNSLSKLKMMGYILYEKIEILEEYNTVLIYLSREELAKFNIRTGDTEGFVNIGLSIKGIKLSALIIDRTKLIKMSFRSKGEFPCNEFAKRHFDGGGHKNAAGGSSFGSLNKTVAKFKEVLSEYKSQLS